MIFDDDVQLAIEILLQAAASGDQSLTDLLVSALAAGAAASGEAGGGEAAAAFAAGEAAAADEAARFSAPDEFPAGGEAASGLLPAAGLFLPAPLQVLQSSSASPPLTPGGVSVINGRGAPVLSAEEFRALKRAAAGANASEDSLDSEVARAAWQLLLLGRNVAVLQPPPGAGASSSRHLGGLLPALLGAADPAIAAPSPQVLVLAADADGGAAVYRELARQSRASGGGVRVCSVFGGGVACQRHAWDLETLLPHVVVATADRFLELVAAESTSLAFTRLIVISDLQRIVVGLSQRRPATQDILQLADPTAQRLVVCSSDAASLELERWLLLLCPDPAIVMVPSLPPAKALAAGPAAKAALAARHAIVMVQQEERRHQRVIELLLQHRVDRYADGEFAVCYCETRRSCEALEQAIQRHTSIKPALQLGGSKRQAAAGAGATTPFDPRKTAVLITASTLELARSASLVINVDVPNYVRQYFHRLEACTAQQTTLITVVSRRDCSSRAKTLREICSRLRADGHFVPAALRRVNRRPPP